MLQDCCGARRPDGRSDAARAPETRAEPHTTLGEALDKENAARLDATRARMLAVFAEADKRDRAREDCVAAAHADTLGRGECLTSQIAHVQSQMEELTGLLRRTDAPDAEVAAERLRLNTRSDALRDAHEAAAAGASDLGHMETRFIDAREHVQAATWVLCQQEPSMHEWFYMPASRVIQTAGRDPAAALQDDAREDAVAGKVF